MSTEHDDLLSRAARSLQEETEGPSSAARFTRLRVMAEPARDAGEAPHADRAAPAVRGLPRRHGRVGHGRGRGARHPQQHHARARHRSASGTCAAAESEAGTAKAAAATRSRSARATRKRSPAPPPTPIEELAPEPSVRPAPARILDARPQEAPENSGFRPGARALPRRPRSPFRGPRLRAPRQLGRVSAGCPERTARGRSSLQSSALPGPPRAFGNRPAAPSSRSLEEPPAATVSAKPPGCSEFSEKSSQIRGLPENSSDLSNKGLTHGRLERKLHPPGHDRPATRSQHSFRRNWFGAASSAASLASSFSGLSLLARVRRPAELKLSQQWPPHPRGPGGLFAFVGPSKPRPLPLLTYGDRTVAASVTNLSPNETRPETRRLTGSQIIWDSLVNEGVQVVFGYPGGAIMPAYDALPQYPDRASHPGAPRTGRGPHGRRLRARLRLGRWLCRDLGPRRDQPGHRHRQRDDGFDPDRLHHRPGRLDPDRQRRLPGDRHHRHHAADHQAQLLGDARRRTSCRRIRQGVLHRELGAPGSGAGRHHQGRAASASCEYRYDTSPVRLPGYRPEQLPAAGARSSERVELIQKAQAPDHLLRSRRDQGQRHRRCCLEFVHKTNIPVAQTLLGLGGFPPRTSAAWA